MTLYEINEQIKGCLDEETGEVINEELLESLQLAEDEKIENIALWIKNLKAEAEALKAEKQAFADRQKSAENKIEGLQRYLSNYLNGKVFSTPKVSIKWRKSESVVIDNPVEIPEEFLKYEPKVDKVSIKDAIKDGAVVAGCHIESNNNIQIK